MEANDLMMNLAVLGIFIFVIGMITVTKKGDSEQTRTMKRIGRQTLSVTLGLLIVMALFALWVKKTSG